MRWREKVEEVVKELKGIKEWREEIKQMKGGKRKDKRAREVNERRFRGVERRN